MIYKNHTYEKIGKGYWYIAPNGDTHRTTSIVAMKKLITELIEGLNK